MSDSTAHVQPRPYPPSAPDSDARRHADSAAAVLRPARIEAGVPDAAPGPIADLGAAPAPGTPAP